MNCDHDSADVSEQLSPNSPCGPGLDYITYPSQDRRYLEKKTSALFLLTMKETFGVSQKAIDGIVKESNDLFQRFAERLQDSVFQSIREAGMNPDSLPSLKDIFRIELQSPFRELSSHFLQEQFYRQSLNLVVSIISAYLSLNFVHVLASVTGIAIMLHHAYVPVCYNMIF